MSRRKLNVPAYTRHKSTGQARVRINGRDHYLGTYGSPESRGKYGELIAAHAAGLSINSAPPVVEPAGISVAELLLAFEIYAAGYYQKGGKPTAEVDCFRSAIRPARKLFGLLPVKDFGPQQLEAVRSSYVDIGWSRGFVNKSTNRLRRIFKWGVTKGTVPTIVWQGLLAIEPLRAGRTKAPDYPPRQAVELERILAARGKLKTHYQQFLDLLRFTGARPSELLGLSWRDIDRSDAVWVATLVDHKCVHLGKTRKLYFGPRSQAVLAKCANKTGKPFRFAVNTFSNQLKAACAAAKVKAFTPYHLRHSAGTDARDELGHESAQALLGHAKPDMTARYTQKLDRIAKEAAAAIG